MMHHSRRCENISITIGKKDTILTPTGSLKRHNWGPDSKVSPNEHSHLKRTQLLTTLMTVTPVNEPGTTHFLLP